MKNFNILKTALTALASTGLALAATQTLAASNNTLEQQDTNTMKQMNNKCGGWPKKGQEKCYGIVAKGMNDCATSTHSCAGQSKADSHPEEWVYVAKGLCSRIAGGKSKPGKA